MRLQQKLSERDFVFASLCLYTRRPYDHAFPNSLCTHALFVSRNGLLTAHMRSVGQLACDEMATAFARIQRVQTVVLQWLSCFAFLYVESCAVVGRVYAACSVHFHGWRQMLRKTLSFLIEHPSDDD